MTEKKKSQLERLSSKEDYPQLEELTQEQLLDKLQVLDQENLELKSILQEYGIEYQGNKKSDTELICLKQLKILQDISRERRLEKDEVMAVDIFHKNLLISKNIPIKKVQRKEDLSTEELLKRVKSIK